MVFRPAILRELLYRLYYRIPRPVQRHVVRWLTPNYTVGAVVLLRDEQNRLLLVRQLGVSRWSLPGGLLNRGENPRQAAVRELREEVGVVLDLEALREASPNAQIHSRSQQVDTVFTSTVNSEHVKLRAEPTEIAEVAWHSVTALPAITGATARLLSPYGLGPHAS